MKIHSNDFRVRPGKRFCGEDCGGVVMVDCFPLFNFNSHDLSGTATATPPVLTNTLQEERLQARLIGFSTEAPEVQRVVTADAPDDFVRV